MLVDYLSFKWGELFIMKIVVNYFKYENRCIIPFWNFYEIMKKIVFEARFGGILPLRFATQKQKFMAHLCARRSSAIVFWTNNSSTLILIFQSLSNSKANISIPIFVPEFSYFFIRLHRLPFCSRLLPKINHPLPSLASSHPSRLPVLPPQPPSTISCTQLSF